MRLALAGPSPSTSSASAGRQPGELRRPGPFVQLSPKAAKPRGYFGPYTGHLRHSHSNKGSRSQRVRLAGLRGPRCANCWHPSFQLPQWPTLRGREGKCSLGGQAEQVRGACVPTAPKKQCVFFFQSPNLFFFFISFFLKKNNKKPKPKVPKNLCGPSIVTLTVPRGGRGA